ncbi:MAG TPA: hypothetical protein DIT13_06565 [Verrucomicrobiales bacterium]|nr:hypothetical protein [Verrucomicrobiales bacterium]HRJ09222.1 PcfJ domain-containing protein [Prosthecobacter sp.]HRK13116.1 PcfJ domain-containing protein [Prosthecobacter sp.]
MKKHRITHGSRHRPSAARTRHREQRYLDAEVLGRDFVEDEWHTTWDEIWDHHFNLCGSGCCHDHFDTTYKAVLAFLTAPEPLEARVETGVWERISVLEDGGDDCRMDDEEPSLMEPEQLEEGLRLHMRAVHDDKTQVRELLRFSQAELAVLREFRTRTPSGNPARGEISHPVVRMLAWLLVLEPFWLRSPVTWSMPAICDEGAVISLTRHLFVHHPVPECLLRTPLIEPGPQDGLGWFPWKWFSWLILLGGGGSVRRAASQMGWWTSGEFMRQLHLAPAHMTPDEGSLWAEVRRHGGSEALFQAFHDSDAFNLDPTDVPDAALAGRIPDWFRERMAFRRLWQQTLEWMCRHLDELPVEDLSVILTWVSHCHAETGRGRGAAFSFKGRTSASVLRAANMHADEVLAAQEFSLGRLISWQGQGWDACLTDAQEINWTVKELVSNRELAEEGRAMRHCVASYARRCESGLCAVFSVRRGGIRVLTVEVGLPQKEILQIRGSCNRAPHVSELEVVNQWFAEVAAAPGKHLQTGPYSQAR